MTAYVYSSDATGLCVLIQHNTSACISLSDMLLLKSQRGKAPVCFIESGHWSQSGTKLLLLFSLTITLHFCFDLYFQTCLWSKKDVFPFAPLNQSKDSHSCQKAALVTNVGVPGAPRASLHSTHLHKHLLNTSGATSPLADAWGWMLLLTPTLGNSLCLSAGVDSRPLQLIKVSLTILLDMLHKQIYLHFSFAWQTGLNKLIFLGTDRLCMCGICSSENKQVTCEVWEAVAISAGKTIKFYR